MDASYIFIIESKPQHVKLPCVFLAPGAASHPGGFWTPRGYM